MGMFDSLYDSNANEWQTKALACSLDRFDIGDTVPGPPIAYQMRVLGGPRIERSVFAYATIRDGRLASVPDERDVRLPLLDYYGGWLSAPGGY